MGIIKNPPYLNPPPEYTYFSYDLKTIIKIKSQKFTCILHLELKFQFLIMSFVKTNDIVKDDDTAIIYLNHNLLYPVKITKSLTYNMKYGNLKYSDVIGKKYGSKIKCSRGTVYILQGSPELWTVSLPHRTQILYTPDISFISLNLELKPGSVVLESGLLKIAFLPYFIVKINQSGTGSASLSHAIVRSIFPTGHLHTFEFHQQRSETARKEFEVKV